MARKEVCYSRIRSANVKCCGPHRFLIHCHLLHMFGYMGVFSYRRLPDRELHGIIINKPRIVIVLMIFDISSRTAESTASLAAVNDCVEHGGSYDV